MLRSTIIIVVLIVGLTLTAFLPWDKVEDCAAAMGTDDPTLGRGPFVAKQCVLALMGDGSTINARGFIQLGRQAAGLTAGDRIGTIDFITAAKEGEEEFAKKGLKATIDVQAAGNGGEFGHGANILFHVKPDNSAAWLTPLMIRHDGKVGFGTRNPLYELSILETLGFHKDGEITSFGNSDLNLNPGGDLLYKSMVVSIGPPNSCGKGFRCFRIPNY